MLKAIVYGALVGLVFSSPEVDLTFPDLFPKQFLLELANILVLFGLPAGIILSFLDSRRGYPLKWIAIIKAPATIVGGVILLFIPIAINVSARLGSEWLTGGVECDLLRQVIGLLAGSCFGLAVEVVIIANELIKEK